MLKSLLSHTVREVTVSQLEKSNDVILLDSREKKEYDVSHLKIQYGLDILILI